MSNTLGVKIEKVISRPGEIRSFRHVFVDFGYLERRAAIKLPERTMIGKSPLRMAVEHHNRHVERIQLQIARHEMFFTATKKGGGQLALLRGELAEHSYMAQGLFALLLEEGLVETQFGGAQ